MSAAPPAAPATFGLSPFFSSLAPTYEPSTVDALLPAPPETLEAAPGFNPAEDAAPAPAGLVPAPAGPATSLATWLYTVPALAGLLTAAPGFAT